MKRVRQLITALVCIAALSACKGGEVGEAQTAADDTVRAWFDLPLPGSVAYPPSPACPVVAHGAAPDGIALFELSINGEVKTIPSEDVKSPLVTLRSECGLTEPGSYKLRLRVQDNSGSWSGYAQTSLTISDSVTATPAAESAGLALTAVPPSTDEDRVAIESISAEHIYAGEETCGPREVTIVARATARKGIEVVVLFYRFETGGGAAYRNTVMQPMGGDFYQAVLNTRSILRRSVPFRRATLQYQVVVQQKDGDTSLRTPVIGDIIVEACGNPALACSGYSNQPACESHGCNWVMIPGIVPLYKCQSP